ncbi:M13 family metallopeptidase [Flavobacteriaceae bacterium]|nr:M13 family metallopeptidase [Flavobacteriaceae bacterium]
MNKKIQTAFLLGSLFLSLVACETTKKAGGIDLSLMDTEVRPQDNFYNYVNGTWMKNTEIPDDKTRWGSFNELRENTDADVLAILKKAANDPNLDSSSDEGKAVTVFQLINDTLARNELGIKPLIPHIERIEAIQSKADLQPYLEENIRLGGYALFGFGVSADAKDSNKNVAQLYPGALGIERDYYLKEDEDSKKIKNAYEKHVARMFGFLGKTAEEAKVLAQEVIAVEAQLATARMDKVERRNPAKRYNPRTTDEMGSIAKQIDWPAYLAGIGTEGVDNLVVTDLGFFSSLDAILNENSISAIKTYLLWTLIDGTASRLSMDIDRANWDFYSKTLRGAIAQEPLEKRSIRTVNGTLGEALGKLYVSEKFPPEAKAQMKELVGNLVKAYTNRINALSWMDAETKAKAIKKLELTNVKVGYPDQWEDYSGLSLTNETGEMNYFDAMLNVGAYNFAENIAELGQAVDKTKWFMSPQTVNAYYNPAYNEIVFPAAILQPPFFDFTADAAVNYGGIGGVIGHEISHGFDDSGTDYDAYGNLVNWWTEKDLNEFNSLGEKLADQYSALEVLPETFINGKFTLGENIGDVGGIHAAFDALAIHHEENGKPAPIDGFSSEERFFLSWGTIWRGKIRDEALKNQVRTDPHSPGYNRANQPLKNMDAFYATFNVQEGDQMYLPKEERVYIW